MPSSDRTARLAVVTVLAPALIAGLTACASTAGAGTTTATPAGTAAPVTKGVSRVSVELLAGEDGDTCALSHTTAKAGPVTFTVANTSATGITEVELMQGQRILGEKENLAPGLAAVSFTTTLTGGAYAFRCPGATAESTPFTVTGTAAARTGSSARALLTAGTATYGDYVSGTLGDLVVAVRRLKAAVDSGDVTEAKARYALARPFYERVESDVAGFVVPGTDPTDNAGNLDYLVDMRASTLDPAVGWHGFHAIERDLWQRGRISGGTKTLAAALLTDVQRLRTLAASLDYRPEDLANGAAGLLEEVQSSKITGEEEAYSHLDLVDLAANIEGAGQAFANLEPGMRRIDPELTEQIGDRFQAVEDALRAYRDAEQAGGYRPWTATLRASDAATLSRLVQSLQDPLSRIAEKVATA